MFSLLTNNSKLFLYGILVLGLFFRIFGLNWDSNNHFHPDERMIVMVALKIQIPETPLEWENLQTPQSTLNPNFFAYGSLPIYLLKIAGGVGSLLNPTLSEYDGITLLGRFLSVLFDVGSILLLYLLGKKVFSNSVGLLASLFYSVSVLPIQLAHFWAVDTPLTFFILLSLYRIVIFKEKPQFKNSALLGLTFGLAISTKVSAILLFIPLGLSLIQIHLSNPQKTLNAFVSLLSKIILVGLFALGVFALTNPYSLIDYPTFFKQIGEQQRMTSDAFTFPFTLQYVGKIPYFYELKNIFFWGLGPIISTASFLGLLLTLINIKRINFGTLLILIFFISYFLVVGRFAIGFMRYLLPIYPLLCLFAAISISKVLHMTKVSHFKFYILNSTFSILLLIWPLSFISIYTKPNTRIEGSEWIHRNVPANSTIAREHWDDGLPLSGPKNFKLIDLPIYDLQNPFIEKQVYNALKTADYLVVASHRLYVPLQRIALNCEAWKIASHRCPKSAAQYYQKLFDGSLGFIKVAEFSSLPKVPILNIPINDFSADESFTVYDHPKVIIFKKITSPTI
ncbi:MAG: glycosyltransferase family 39 protein [Candidatus Daviesbacteria bacterium]|nr:glycosyltransferase family 39 protein [Candidatus Daviesbacteria bacterium]